MPEEPIVGFKILEAWKEWVELLNRGPVNFSELPMEIRQRVILGAELIMRASGMEVTESYTVIQKRSSKDRDKRGWPNAILTFVPEKEVRRILEGMGINPDD